MATYKQTTWDRSGPDNRTFSRPRGAEPVDLSAVRFLHTGVDTIRQLYNGNPTEEYYRLEGLYRQNRRGVVRFAGHEWALKSGIKGGYRFLLQNADLGLVILMGAAHIAREDRHGTPKRYTHGPHLKIECSPHWLYERSAYDAQTILDALAAEVLDEPEPSGVAVHVCLDFQGWKMPSRDDFANRIVTRARVERTHNGITAGYAVSEAAVIHGDCQTVTYGRAAGLQMQLYDKTTASLKADSIQWWRKLWRKASGRELGEQPFDESETVRRLEFRFHHSVVRQFAQTILKETGEVVNDYRSIASHLNGLWRYALNNFRLQYSTTYIDPFWQLLMEDVTFHDPQGPDLLYKREYKEPGEGSEVNTKLLLGNMVTLLARRGVKAHQAWGKLQKEQMWPDIYEYYRRRGYSLGLMWVDFKERFLQRQLNRALSA